MKILLCKLLFAFMLISVLPGNIQEKTTPVTKTTKDHEKKLFYEPGGGLAMVEYEVTLKEMGEYNPKTKKTKYFRHEYSYMWYTEYTSTKPNFRIYGISHYKGKDSRVLKCNKKGQIIYDKNSRYKYHGCKYSNEAIEYEKNCGYKSRFRYASECTANILPSYLGKIEIELGGK